ncbi:hypothetical protein [Nocardia sp. NPDC006630]|uniref:DUF7373 family lipoprotein n=1 Tax=Nocardia sp. NPDC006630 TaxID=3157181 RepID=UPI0033A9044E
MKFFSNRLPTAGVAFNALAFVLTSAALVSCGSSTDGTAIAGEVDVRKFAVGTYPTIPADLRGSYRHEALSGTQLAVARLADAVATGPDVDPSFAHGVMQWSITTLGSVSSVLANATEPVAERNNVMFGYSASASTRPLPDTGDPSASGIFHPFGGGHTDPDATSFNITVLQFPSAQEAESAATQMEAADFDVAADLNTHISLDKYPSAKAHWRQGIPSMAATLAHGQYVVNVFVQLPKPELAGLKNLIEKVYAAQVPLLDQTPPLSAREVLFLDYDPYGMVRRTLHPDKLLRPNADTEATRTPRGYLHYVDDQIAWKRLLDDNRVDRISTTQKGALLLRTPDTKSATALWAGINGLTTGTADRPANVPDVACAENPKPKRDSYDNYWDEPDRFICTVRYDRYVARVAGAQLADVHQRAAAQYALLANSQYL